MDVEPDATREALERYEAASAALWENLKNVIESWDREVIGAGENPYTGLLDILNGKER